MQSVLWYPDYMNAMLAPVDEDILPLPEAAAALGISHVTLWRMVKEGRVPAVPIGRIRGILRKDLDAARLVIRKPGRPRRPGAPPTPPPG